MNHGSLFSGIGGFDLASEWMGWENVFHCEWNDFGQRVLKHYWPKAKSYADITTTDFTIHRRHIDILTGGFPCQPYSISGKRKGKKDNRHLWPEMLRAIREIQPTWVVGENVFGLVNWNGGLVFDEIQADLEVEGYEVQPYVLPAVSVNAPHRRDRICFVAYSRRNELQKRFFRERTESNSSNSTNSGLESMQGEEISSDKSEITSNSERARSYKRECFRQTKLSNQNGEKRNDVASSCGSGREQLHFSQKPNKPAHGTGSNYEDAADSTDPDQQRKRLRQECEEKETGRCCSGGAGFENFPTQSPVCNGNDGISSRLDGITFPKWRNESIKAGGNAIVPQVAHQIFKAIEDYIKINRP